MDFVQYSEPGIEAHPAIKAQRAVYGYGKIACVESTIIIYKITAYATAQTHALPP
jgi:hypothetical protein